ncbi:MAG TPA: LPS export ABC transporter periplasmic protein LptC [Candidatus Sulfotelmatobacter sp.]|nr:LPS export ABC transporter periplasmic protein LptC [Candidatus Sulfotelmatobacter sp.]
MARFFMWTAHAAVLFVLSFGITRTGYPAMPVASNGDVPEITLESVHMVETRGGSRLWEVRADRAEVFERDGYTVLLRQARPVEVTLFSNRGQLVCLANRATLDLKTKDVQLRGNVVARSDQGTELKTETLNWTAATRRLATTEAVTIRRGTLTSQGQGMEAETDLERVRIQQNITSELRSKAAPGRSSAP